MVVLSLDIETQIGVNGLYTPYLPFWSSSLSGYATEHRLNYELPRECIDLLPI